MSAPHRPEDAATAAPAGLRATLELRLLETAARYLYVNSLPLPFVIIGLCVILWHWYSLTALVSWAACALASCAWNPSKLRWCHMPLQRMPCRPARQPRAPRCVTDESFPFRSLPFFGAAL